MTKTPIAAAAPDDAPLARVRAALTRFSDIRPGPAVFSTAAERAWERFYIQWEQSEKTGLYAAAVKRICRFPDKMTRRSRCARGASVALLDSPSEPEAREQTFTRAR